MAGQAGYIFTISVATSSGGSFSELAAQNATFNRTANVLDDTDTSNAGYMTRLLGLLDTACNAEVHWAASDTALGLIETAYENRSALWVKILPDNMAGNGKKFPVVVESFNLSIDINGLQTYSMSFQGNGAVVADNA